MPRLYDSPSTTVYRVNAVATRFGGILPGGAVVPRDVTVVAVDVIASSPTAAIDWLLSYPWLAGMPASADSIRVTHAYKKRRQPGVWLRKSGTDGYRFDIRYREVAPFPHATADN